MVINLQVDPVSTQVALPLYTGLHRCRQRDNSVCLYLHTTHHVYMQTQSPKSPGCSCLKQLLSPHNCIQMLLNAAAVGLLSAACVAYL